MFSIEPRPLPESALLQAYRRSGAYSDCYATEVTGAVPLEQYIAAFYTTPVFKTERFILKWLVRKPSTDADALGLAAGSLDRFAAWTVEARDADQLLLCDFLGRTRSWLMVEARGATTQLYFGSAVVPSRRTGTMGFGFGATLAFHKLYSQVLLSSAAKRLNK
jgi:hypothetical protein